MSSHSEVLAHLVRRGCHGAHAAISQIPEMHKDADGAVSPMAVAVIGFTIIVAALALSSIHYTLTIVKTLAMIEDNKTTYVLREEKSEKLLEADALAEDEIDSVLVVKKVAVTSNIRTTLRHLQDVGGFRARWRGLRAMIAYGVTYSLLNGTIARAIYSPAMEEHVDIHKVAASRGVSSLVSHVALSLLAMTWTHIVISEPSAKAWYQRIPSVKTWRQIAGATAINTIVRQLVFAIPAMLFFRLGLNDKALYSGASLESGEARGAIIGLLSVAVIALVAFVGFAIPADVALVRVQASMLPEGDNTIVSFDRTFGGKVVPTSLGGSGKIGFADAWLSWDVSNRLRLLKLYVKAFMIEACLHALFAYLVATEVFVLAGPAIARLVASQSDSGEIRIQ